MYMRRHGSLTDLGAFTEHRADVDTDETRHHLK